MSGDAQLFGPGTDEYAAATQPHNSSAHQAPAFVARPRDADGVASTVTECRRRGLVVLPQGTGHGAGAQIGTDTVILDTTGLDALTIDASARVATAGAGLTWGQVNKAAEQHGLLGLAGSAPTVCISGYTFGGGIGWLCRPHGMAASALRRVQYVDGRGVVREASDDGDQLDRDAMWAFRGGGGVGIATELEFELVPVSDLHAGYLLWTIEHLAAVTDAWAQAMGQVSDDVATSISVLHVPPAPPFPEQLRGKPVVHLAVAASRGADGAHPLLERVRAAAAPEVDTWGPADAQALGGIHLDPPDAVPAIGEARWLTDAAASLAGAMLAIAAPADSPLAMLEIRSVGNTAPARSGAETSVPGPYLVHAVGALTDPDARGAIDDSFAALRRVSESVDAGRSVGSWMEGAQSVPDALPPETRSRVAAIADAVDPDGLVRRSRFLT